jgi:hypothetical protein
MSLPLFEPEVAANPERAEESLRAAQLLYEAGHGILLRPGPITPPFMPPPRPC